MAYFPLRGRDWWFPRHGRDCVFVFEGRSLHGIRVVCAALAGMHVRGVRKKTDGRAVMSAGMLNFALRKHGPVA